MNSERIYQGNDELWYFNVRGNLVKGPFTTFHEAEMALIHDLRQWQKPFTRPTWPKPLQSLKIRKQRTEQARQV
jgi:hypothetical protein